MVVDIYINGERLLDKILAFEREEASEDFEYHGLLTPEHIHFTLLGRRRTRGFNYIFGCASCGEPGCDPVNVDIKECDGNVIWENIRFDVYTDDGKKEIKLPDEYIFSSKEYYSQVRSLREWFFDVYRCYSGKKIRKHTLISIEKRQLIRSNRFAMELCDIADQMRRVCNSIEDYEALKEVCETAAFAGNTTAMNYLGVIYHNGLLGERDYGKAMEWYVRAARGRRVYAVMKNESCLLFDSPGVTIAKANIAKLYEHGLGVAANGEAAFELYKEVIKDGDLTAYCDLAYFYEKGIGTDIDTNKAIKYYNIAIENGSVEALTRLGWHYYKGDIVTRDGDKAHELLEKAVKRGAADACGDLAQYYYDGIYVAKDYDKVLQYLRLGIARGDTQCMSNLGMMYENGYGVEKDMVKANEWYERSKDPGSKAIVCQKKERKMDERLEQFVKKHFSLTPEMIDSMSDSEFDELYEKAMALEEVLAVDDPEDENIETILAADFVDYLHDL